jgi:hypothetical protein
VSMQSDMQRHTRWSYFVSFQEKKNKLNKIFNAACHFKSELSLNSTYQVPQRSHSNVSAEKLSGPERPKLVADTLHFVDLILPKIKIRKRQSTLT